MADEIMVDCTQNCQSAKIFGHTIYTRAYIECRRLAGDRLKEKLDGVYTLL